VPACRNDVAATDALLVLQNIHTEASAASIEASLSDEDVQVRTFAAAMLGQVRWAPLQRKLERASLSSDASVRRAAEKWLNETKEIDEVCDRRACCSEMTFN